MTVFEITKLKRCLLKEAEYDHDPRKLMNLEFVSPVMARDLSQSVGSCQCFQLNLFSSTSSS